MLGEPDFLYGKEYFMLDWYDQKNLVFLGLNDMDYNRNMWVICIGDVLQKIISSLLFHIYN
jgi:hypothetical protein